MHALCQTEMNKTQPRFVLLSKGAFAMFNRMKAAMRRRKPIVSEANKGVACDPLMHPALRSMNQRELGDLPL